MHVEIVLLFVVFERQKNELSGYCSLSMLSNYLKSEAFPREAMFICSFGFYGILLNVKSIFLQKQFYFEQFSLALVHSLVLFES